MRRVCGRTKGMRASLFGLADHVRPGTPCRSFDAAERDCNKVLELRPGQKVAEQEVRSSTARRGLWYSCSCVHSEPAVRHCLRLHLHPGYRTRKAPRSAGQPAAPVQVMPPLFPGRNPLPWTQPLSTPQRADGFGAHVLCPRYPAPCAVLPCPTPAPDPTVQLARIRSARDKLLSLEVAATSEATAHLSEREREQLEAVLQSLYEDAPDCGKVGPGAASWRAVAAGAVHRAWMRLAWPMGGRGVASSVVWLILVCALLAGGRLCILITASTVLPLLLLRES